jgi:hypothetical protein
MREDKDSDQTAKKSESIETKRQFEGKCERKENKCSLHCSVSFLCRLVFGFWPGLLKTEELSRPSRPFCMTACFHISIQWTSPSAVA